MYISFRRTELIPKGTIRDYKKFLDFFKRPAEVFPQSPLVGRAKIWIGIKRLNREIKELDEAIKKSKRVDMSAAEL